MPQVICGVPSPTGSRRGCPEGPEHFFYDGSPRSARWLLGQLWRCSDVSGALCDELDLPRGSTYAAAVQGFAASLSGGSSDAGRG
jgi:hypothetical protein